MDAVAIEHTLCRELEEQLRRYGRALLLVQAFEMKLAQEECAAVALKQTTALLDEIHGIEARIAPIRAIWFAARPDPCPRLKSLALRVRNAIEALMKAVGEAQNAARTRLDHLDKAVSSSLLAVKMHQAYAGRHKD